MTAPRVVSGRSRAHIPQETNLSHRRSGRNPPVPACGSFVMPQYQPGRRLSAAVWSLLWARGPTHSQLAHGLALCRLVPACPHICLLDRVPIRGCPLPTT